jgi:hypothetical protein
VKIETVVDKEALDRGQFHAKGGFARLNKVFEGKLEAARRSSGRSVEGCGVSRRSLTRAPDGGGSWDRHGRAALR